MNSLSTAKYTAFGGLDWADAKHDVRLQAAGSQIGVMNPGEIVIPLKTLSHVTGARAVATEDHNHIFEGNVFIANADGVRFEGLWNYCERNNSCWADAKTRPSSVANTFGHFGELHPIWG